jgi:hypothetical protein
MKKLIVTCHCIEVLALAVWVGGLASIITAVIPAVFSTIGMEAGGRMLTRTFQGYDHLTQFAAALLLLAMMVRTWGAGVWSRSTSWREQVSMTELVLLMTMVAIAATLTFWLTPETARLQEIAFSAKDDAKRVAYDNFFAYHRIARALYLINLGLGMTLLCVKVQKWVR